MSKTLKKLNNTQEQRSNTDRDCHSMITGTVPAKAIPKNAEGTVPKGLNAKASNVWILGLVVAIMLFAILGISARTFNKVRLNDFERSELSAKIDKMQEQIDSNNAVINKLTDILDRVTLKIKYTDTKLTELEKDKDSQSFAIENLTKAKDALFKRVSAFEVFKK